MSRKGANIYKRKDGRWEARYVKSIGVDGKKKYASVYGTTYTEAKSKQIHCLQSLDLSSNSKVTLSLSNLMHEWLNIKENAVKPSTHQKYLSMIQNHIDHQPIGDVAITMLTSTLISDYTAEKLNEHGLSAKTVNDILAILNLALSYGEEVYSIRKPKISRVKESNKIMRVLSVEEQKTLERYLVCNMNTYHFGILLTLYTGIRLGELCALNWDDLHDGCLSITKTMYRIKTGNKTKVIIAEPKTQASNRMIPLPTALLSLIESWRSSGSLLKTRSGGVVEPRLMQLRFARTIEDCGLAKTNFHALRHTFATRCIEAGFDIKSLSEILGHTDVKTTLNKYVHSSFDQKQKNQNLKTTIS